MVVVTGVMVLVVVIVREVSDPYCSRTLDETK